MDLDNETPFAARLLRYQPTEDGPVQATVVAKATFERAPDGGTWTPAAEQLPIINDMLETPFGVFHGDNFVRKEGVDVCVLGTVRTPRPMRAAQLSLSVGRHLSEVIVFGDRQWVKTGSRLVASGPLAFEEMPLAYTHAYGGKTPYDYETAIWPDNPLGRGYYLTPEAAEGQPLPNIEQGRGSLVREWSDQIAVAGWGPYPCYWGIRAREGVEPAAQIKDGDFGRIKARLNNNAHSSLIVAEVPPDAEIRIRGMQPGELVFTVPPFAPVIEARTGERIVEARGQLDGVFLWTDAQRVTVTHRLQFSYAYEKGQRRRARLIDATPRKRA
ncbi:MAG TPA: DUF2169 domain-containing protein [Polyangia bacterium]|nr:DUF2169 domain-containing protein [Polyangia bacterium]